MRRNIIVWKKRRRQTTETVSNTVKVDTVETFIDSPSGCTTATYIVVDAEKVASHSKNPFTSGTDMEICFSPVRGKIHEALST